ncbi:MAG: Flp pilus assembly complex ATPase component TadA, partial [Oscillospiraceae bacterium]|nr:Flp pilus assembly complex ATPase component TadA [Oscillospiraceae bacterium]
MKYVKLGDLLVNSGCITQAQLDEALALQEDTGQRLGSILQTHGFITERQLIDTLMSQLGVEFIDLNTYPIPPEMAQLLPKSAAKKHMAVPVRATRTDVHLAMADPLNFVAIEEVRAITRRRVIPLIAASAAVERAVQNLYSNQGAMQAIEDMQRDLLGSQYGAAAPAQPQSMTVDEDEADAAPAIRLVNSIIDRACTEGASDIHMEPGEDSMTIRMRIDGALRAITRRRVIPLIAASAAVERAVQNLYSNQGAMQAIEDMQRDLLGSQYGAAAPAQPQSMTVDEDEADAAPAIRLVNSIIDRACTEGASDIHMEPGEDSMTIRMRIDGALRAIIPVPRELQSSVISRLKIMARMDIAQKLIPQDGRANVTVRQESLDLRISTLPTIHGEKVVIRLLRKTPELATLEGIGLEGGNRERFCRLVDNATEGVILMVGPTGSGKTSTLYA